MKRRPKDSADTLLDDQTRESVRSALLDWYSREKRDLPWRRTQDPYAVWVSEIMLQQTRVETVVPYFERFLDRFPDIPSLAAAPLDDVLALWSGLGYYRRARSLHAAAEILDREHAGRFPDTLREALELPGIGRYTAGAILSITKGLPTPVVDGNVHRVLSRLFRLGTEARPALFWSLAERLVDGSRPGDLNQALMELGARVCVPRTPRCDACPLAGSCRARSAGDSGDFPPPKEKPATIDEHRAVGVARDDRGRFFVARRTDGTVLRDLWEFPWRRIAPEADPTQALVSLYHEVTGAGFRPRRSLPIIRHAIMNRRIRVHAVEGTLARALAEPEAEAEPGEARWMTGHELAAAPVGGIVKKILRGIENAEG